MAKVDVLIPTYNRGTMLQDSVRSILGQSFKDFRIVIYDDGSTDDSLDQLPSDPRIEVIRGEENKGIAHARTQLLAQVEAPFCAWQDSDDISDPHRLRKMLDHIEEVESDIAFSYLHFFRGSFKRRHWHLYKVDTTKYKTPEQGGPDHYGLDGNMTHPTAVFRQAVVKYPVEDMRRPFGSDRFWLMSLLRAGFKFSYLPEPLYYLRRHDGRVTTRRKQKRASSPALEIVEEQHD